MFEICCIILDHGPVTYATLCKHVSFFLCPDSKLYTHTYCLCDPNWIVSWNLDLLMVVLILLKVTM